MHVLAATILYWQHHPCCLIAFSSVHADAMCCMCRSITDDHVSSQILDSVASKLTRIDNRMSKIRQDAAVGIGLAAKRASGCATRPNLPGCLGREWHVQGAVVLASSIGCPVSATETIVGERLWDHPPVGWHRTLARAQLSMAALGAAAVVEQRASATARWLRRLHASRNRPELAVLRRGALRNRLPPAAHSSLAARFRRLAGAPTSAVASLHRRVSARCRRLPAAPASGEVPAAPIPPAMPGEEVSARGIGPPTSVRHTAARSAHPVQHADELGWSPARAEQRAEALVVERAASSTDQDALEAQAEQVAALAALIGREVASQAETVQTIDTHADQASQNTEAAKLELLLAVGAGPWFGRCVCLLLSGMATLLLLLHLLTP